MSDWFDGQFPRWEVALAEGVRPRRVAEDVVRRFEAAHQGAPQPLAVLLTGAGGEGKSAALLQVAAKLVLGEQDWTCIWRTAAAAELPLALFSKLEKRPGHAWIVAVDDAENVGRQLFEALRGIQPRTDVHLIMAARDADWSIRGLTDVMWRGTAEFSRVTLAGLDAEDARRIADGWVAYGDEAMGLLAGQPVEKVAEELLSQAQEQAARHEDGALLGALLITREGEDLKRRVTRLMEPWADVRAIGDRSLLDVYAMIAAMHAENQLYLSHATLAFALGCNEVDLDRGPLHVLRREAMVDGGTMYILTRHRKIAEVARDWLVESGYDVDRWYPFLACASRRYFLRTRPSLHDTASWTYGLSRHFVKKGPKYWPAAVEVAKSLFEAERNDPLLLTAYAGTLRGTKQFDAALQLMRRHGPRFRERRDVLYEWSVAAGESGDQGLAVWLAARAIADDSRVPFKENNIRFALAGLGLAFRDMRNQTERDLFATACAAIGRLGLMLVNLDAQGRGYFEKYVAAAPQPAGTSPSVDKDLEILRTAVIEAAYLVHKENEPPFFEDLIGDPETYRYRMMRAVLTGDGGTKTPTRSAH